MARLPQPGGDAGQWGQVLNDFLSQAHKTDGSLKDGIVQTANLAAGAVNNSTITNGSISEAKLDAAAQAKLNATGGGSATLSGDVTGPSSATVVANGAITETKLAAALATKINNKADATHSHSLDSLSDVSAAGATDGQSLVFNGGSWGPGTVGSTGGSVVDATTTTKGVVQLAGDLAGTAAAPRVAGLNGVAVSGTPTAGQVLKATSATAASWQADATGSGGSGGFNYAVQTVTTATYTAAANQALLVDATATGISITLPAPQLNATVWVKGIDTSTNSIQVLPPAGAYIDSASSGSATLNNNYESRVFWSDGNNWFNW